MSAIIETENLTKNFGKFTAVDKVSLTVGKGEIYGFLGLNGAGKTTTIRMLLGMIVPTRGTVHILGNSIKRGGYGPWENIGCLVEVPYSYPDLTVRENLEIYRRLRGIPDTDSVNRIIDRLKLNPYSDRKAGHLSLGNSQRLGLAKALIHNPEILILDEPSNGLDPAGIVEIRELLLDLSKNNSVAIFISSHILAEISKIADRIGIIHNGKLLQEINSSDLDSLVKKRLIIRTRDNDLAMKVLTEKGYSSVINENGDIELTDEKSLRFPENISTALVEKSVPPISLYLDEEDLETYFLRFIQQNGGCYA
jgi:ABC-2 type transport system ATP-binding protein